MNRAARPVERVIHEIQRASPAEVSLVAERNSKLVGKDGLLLCSLSRKGQVVRLAHVEIQIDWVERHHGRKQGRWAAGGPAAGNQVANGDQVAANPTGERSGDAAMVQIEPRVTDLGLGIVKGRLGVLLIRRPLIEVLY